MKKLTRVILTTLGILPMSLFADALEARSSNDVLSETRVIAELQTGQYTGGMLDALVPLWGKFSDFYYMDIQAYNSNSQYQNTGVGFGRRQTYGQAIYGLYGFYDKQTSPFQISYDRFNLGFERLGLTWDFRTNLYYYPNHGKVAQADPVYQSAKVQGNDIIYDVLFQDIIAMNGGSVELGRTLGMANLRGYVGYYRFSNKFLTSDISGISSRLAYQVTDHVHLTASSQYDGARGWLTLGGIQYWFGNVAPVSSKITDITTRMQDQIYRDMTTATKAVSKKTAAIADPNKIYFFSPTGSAGGDGTQANPWGLDQINRAGAHDYIYLMGSGTAYTPTETINLAPGQVLWGSSAAFVRNGVVVMPASGTTTINGGGISGFTCGSVSCIIRAQGNNTIGGFTLTGTGMQVDRIGILVDGAGNTTISNVNVNGFITTGTGSSAGIQISNAAANVSLSNLTISNNDNGLKVRHGIATVTGNNTFTGNNFGIATTNSDAYITIANSTISNSTTNGIYMDEGTINITNSTVSGTTGNGVFVTNGGILNGYNLNILQSGASTAGLFANNGAIVSLINSSIIASNSAKAVTVQNTDPSPVSTSVQITNPTNITGEMEILDGTSITLTQNGSSQPFTNTVTCQTAGGVVTCQ